MPADPIHLRHLAACAIAKEAADLAKIRFLARDRKAFTMKGAQDYLTETDGEVEKLIRQRVAAAFPEDGFLGEEGGGKPKARTWVVDPIDGTMAFARGIPHFCVSIALVEKGKPEIGVIAAPMQDEFYAARRGHGAFLNGRRMKVSDTSKLSESVMEIGWSARRPLSDYISTVETLMQAGANCRRSASGALGMAYVADGRTDCYGEIHINSWDVAAGIVIVREAGGWTNDFFANDGMTKGNPILACTPRLRAALAKAIGKPFGLKP